MRSLPALLTLFALGGCSPVVRFEVQRTPEDPAVAEWRAKVTAGINEHEMRLRALETKGQP